MSAYAKKKERNRNCDCVGLSHHLEVNGVHSWLCSKMLPQLLQKRGCKLNCPANKLTLPSKELICLCGYYKQGPGHNYHNTGQSLTQPPADHVYIHLIQVWCSQNFFNLDQFMQMFQLKVFNVMFKVLTEYRWVVIHLYWCYCVHERTFFGFGGFCQSFNVVMSHHGW